MFKSFEFVLMDEVTDLEIPPVVFQIVMTQDRNDNGKCLVFDFKVYHTWPSFFGLKLSDRVDSRLWQ